MKGAARHLRIPILLLSAFPLAWASNRLAGPDRRLAWFTRLTAAPVRAAPAAEGRKGEESSPWTEIDGDEARRLFEMKAVFFDARRSSVYREGHVRGARSLPVWEDIDERLKSLVSEGLDGSAPVVVYCSGGDCEDSHLLAQKLYLAGFDAVRVYRGGFPDWEARRLPVSKGASP